MSTLLFVALALATTESGPADAAPAKPVVITSPDWVRRPTGRDMANYFPAKAMRDEVQGYATLSCGVSAEGRLVECLVASEEPAEYQFGLAALAMSKLFLMRPLTKDGHPVAGGTVRIPIRFLLPGGPLDPMTAVISCYGETSARSQQAPADTEAMQAYGFFAAQVAMRTASTGMSAAAFEAALSRAREAGLGGRIDRSPGLAECNRAFRDATKQAAKPKR